MRDEALPCLLLDAIIQYEEQKNTPLHFTHTYTHTQTHTHTHTFIRAINPFTAWPAQLLFGQSKEPDKQWSLAQCQTETNSFGGSICWLGDINPGSVCPRDNPHGSERDR